jgi:hypothetical protein
MVPTSSWGKMDFAGRSVLNLRAELALLLGEANPSDITLYAWTGYNIPRIALVVDLPSNMDLIVIGVLSTRSPGESSSWVLGFSFKSCGWCADMCLRNKVYFVWLVLI